MKFRLAFLLATSLCVAGCGKGGAANSEVAAVKIDTAADVAKAFQDAKLPVTDIVVLDAATDSNHLLGRPNQYTSKVFFYDSRHPKAGPNDETGQNTIEVFATEADAKARRDYIEPITKGSPMLMQYFVQNGKVLVRFDKVMLPDEVKAYEAALTKASEN